MALNARFDDDVVVLSNFGPLLNDPRHFDAGRDVREILDQGYRHFVFELAGIREMGPTALGLLVTLTQQVRQSGGEVVLARMSRDTGRFLGDMQMEDYWESFKDVAQAEAFLRE